MHEGGQRYLNVDVYQFGNRHHSALGSDCWDSASIPAACPAGRGTHTSPRLPRTSPRRSLKSSRCLRTYCCRHTCPDCLDTRRCSRSQSRAIGKQPSSYPASLNRVEATGRCPRRRQACSGVMCFMFDRQMTFFADSRACVSAGSSSAMSNAMMEATARNSIRVNARRFMGCLYETLAAQGDVSIC